MPRTPPLLPFLDGPAQVQMGLRPLPLEAWLLPDTEQAWLPAKRALIADRPDEVLAMPADRAARRAAGEAAAKVTAALGGQLAGPADGPDALSAAAAMVSDDLVVMQPRGGSWRLTSAVLCAPTFWRLPAFAGRDLLGLHAEVPGAPPGRDTARLPAQMARFFDRLLERTRAGGDMADPPILWRTNWTVQMTDARFAPTSAPLQRAAARAIAQHAHGPSLSTAAQRGLHLRVERQTLRALPDTGALLFTIRVLVDPLSVALSSEDARAAFAHAWHHTDPALRAYKGWPTLDPLVAALLGATG